MRHYYNDQQRYDGEKLILISDEFQQTAVIEDDERGRFSRRVTKTA